VTQTSEEATIVSAPIATSSSPQPQQDQPSTEESTTEDEFEEDEDADGEFIVFRDHFGFPIEPSHIDAYLAMFEFQFSTRMKDQAEYLAKQLNKMLSTNITRPIVSREFVGFAKSGFPLSHRGDLWQVLSGSKDALRRHPGLYEKLLKRNEGVETVATIQIEKDLHRTFIGNPLLRTKEDVRRLRRVLSAFSFYDPQTGYCQSLNFIAALYLLLMSEEEAFWLLIVTTKRFLPEYYTPDMVGSKTDAHIFEAMLYTYFPLIAHQLYDLGLPVVLRTASWFLCMFVTILPVETTMRVFDWMFVEGSQVIFSVGLALFHLSQSELALSDSFDSAYFTFTTMTQHCYNADHLIELAATKYQLIRKEIALLRTKLRLEYSRRDEQELISSLNLSPEDFYELISQLEEVSTASKTQSNVGSGQAASQPLSAAYAGSATDSHKTRSAKLSAASVPETKEPSKAEIESVVLDKARFVTVFKKIFPDLDPSVPESVFDTLDSDEDASLTIKECLLGISAFVVGAPEKKAMMWFRVFDKNNDGILDVSEIRSLLSLVWKLIDKQLDHSWIDTFLKVVESTHSGRITKAEFVNACLDMPVLSEWLKFGVTLGDRMKIIAAKEEAAQHVAQSESLKKSGIRAADSPARNSTGPTSSHSRSHSKVAVEAPLAIFRPKPDESDDEVPYRLSSSPPHTWITDDGRVNPLLVTGTVSPSHASDNEADGPRHMTEFSDSDADLEDSSFYLV
jgi:Ca2+-binding EF-hand superfamily protein